MELYDFAAGKLIALEAGAKATCFLGKNRILQANWRGQPAHILRCPFYRNFGKRS